MDLLEISERQVAHLKAKYGAQTDVSVYNACFEDFESDHPYDLIYSATAFHWIRSEIGYPKAWRMLRPGGTMAVFWQMSSVTYHDAGIFAPLNAIRRKYLPDASPGFDEAGLRQVQDKRIAQIQSGGCFGAPSVFEYRWTDAYDADRYAALINTYSSTQLLAADMRRRYLDEIRNCILNHGGTIELPQCVHLYLIRK